MPLHAPPPAPAPIHSLKHADVAKMVRELVSSDPTVQQEAIGKYLHPDVIYADHLAKEEGRWNVWRLLRATSALYDVCGLEEQHVVVDTDRLHADVWVDQMFRPRVPLRQYLLPVVRCPTIVRTTWTSQPDGGLLVTYLSFVYSTTYLPSLLGPLGTWCHSHLIQPAGRTVLEAVCELVSFGTACQTFAAKQLSWDRQHTALKPTGRGLTNGGE